MLKESYQSILFKLLSLTLRPTHAETQVAVKWPQANLSLRTKKSLDPPARDPQLFGKVRKTFKIPSSFFLSRFSSWNSSCQPIRLTNPATMAAETPAKSGLAVGLNKGHVRLGLPVAVSPRGGSLLRLRDG
jgi:hypothetical protein